MASTDKSTPVPYSPANPPCTDRVQEVSRSVWEELYRIAERFISMDRPAAMAITEALTATIQPTTVWQRLFNTAPTYDWEAPPGQFSASIWTCPQEGLYSISAIIEVAEFPNPGNRIYEATLRTTLHPVNGTPDTESLSKTGGPDEAALRLIADFLRPLNRGDQVWFDLDLTEDTFTGTVPIFSILNICRMSSVK